MQMACAITYSKHNACVLNTPIRIEQFRANHPITGA
jgi:hypothetical protein